MKRVWLGVASGVALGLLVRPGKILATDTYLALMAGREIAKHGLPHTDSVCVVTQGHVWTDQQWLAQLLMWCVDRVGGLKLDLLFFATVIGIAFGLCAWHASKRGATPAAVLISSGVGFAMGVPFFTPRPQMFSVLGFAALLLLFADDKPTEKMPKRFWWAIPILMLWANLHGVVVIGAGLVGLRAAVDIWKRRSLAAVPIAVLAAATPFCTPYARELPAYFRVIGQLQSPARRLPILEWQRVKWPTDIPFFAVFGVAAALLVVVHVVKSLKPPPLFETLVLVGTGLACWQASRHIQWFGLALGAYGAPLFDALPPVSEGEVIKKVAGWLARLAPPLVVAAAVRLCLLDEAHIETEVPHAALPTLEQLSAEHPDWHLASDDRFADWVIWHVPALRGRVEQDVRFELLDEAQARAMGRFLFPEADWEQLYPDAQMVLVARKPHELLDKRAAAQPGARTVWINDVGRLIVR